jgi:hypothetical protein
MVHTAHAQVSDVMVMLLLCYIQSLTTASTVHALVRDATKLYTRCLVDKSDAGLGFLWFCSLVRLQRYA